MAGKSNPFLKYSSLAFEMLATIAIGVVFGQFADNKLKLKTPYATAGFALLFVAIALYRVLRDLSTDRNSNS